VTSAAGVPVDDAGRSYELGLDPPFRRAEGVFYTPADVAEGLLAVVADRERIGPPWAPQICDPTCGAGAFLLAAADLLEASGHDPRVIVEDLIWGADVDADAIGMARSRLRAWAAERGVEVEPGHLVVGDTLVAGLAAWTARSGRGFDLVVGNPPFQSQLAAPTARTAERAALLRQRLGPAAAAYADSAALFLVGACRMAAPGGRVAMIVPESVLSARDAGPARSAVLAEASLVGLWWAGETVFDAGVRVCAPVLAVGAARPGRVRRWRGRAFEPAGSADVGSTSMTSTDTRRDAEAPWSPLLAALRGTPAVDLGAQPVPTVLGSMATSTAGFRDQYYGIAPFVSEHPAGGQDGGHPSAGEGARVARLITAGLIDPLHNRWGAASTRFAKEDWRAPIVDVEGLGAADPRLAAWGADRLVPKVVVAAQTRVVEVAVDLDGSWWPSVPTIAVMPRSGDVSDLWRIAAVLAAPPVSAWALHHFGGSALSSDAVKLSARQVLAIPLPVDAGAWAAGAEAAAAAQHAADRLDPDGWQLALAQLGDTMTRAYQVGDDVREWWLQRLPIWR
jgi:hypothetical protein